MRLNILIAILFLISSPFINNSSSQSRSLYNPLKTYSGPELPNQQALLLNDSNNLALFESVDGKYKNENGKNYIYSTSLLLMEGEHNIKIKFNNRNPYITVESIVITVELKAKHIYIIDIGLNPDYGLKTVRLNPYAIDITPNKVLNPTDNFLCRIPNNSFKYDLSLYNVKCNFNPPDKKYWMLNRKQAELTDAPLIFHKIKGFDANKHFATLYCNFSKSKLNINDSLKTEIWLKDFLANSYFSNKTTNGIIVKISKIDKSSINDNEFWVINSQITYKADEDKYNSFDNAIIYVSNLKPIQLGKSVVFMLSETNIGDKAKFNELSEKDKAELLAVIKNFTYSDLSKDNIPIKE